MFMVKIYKLNKLKYTFEYLTESEANFKYIHYRNSGYTVEKYKEGRLVDYCGIVR